MTKEGKYIYCIIGGNEGRNFGMIGIGEKGALVSTLGYQDISAVISNFSLGQYTINRENLTTHEKVIEEVMKGYTVLPVRFCTVANNAEEVRGFLRRRYGEFKGLLRDLDNKVELGLKARWKTMKEVFAQIAASNTDVMSRMETGENSGSVTEEAQRIAIGKVVKDALDKLKEQEAQKIFGVLSRAAVETRKNQLLTDDMFLNAAFLIDRTREKQFDFLVEDLVREYAGRVEFKYVGPVPPFNFVNVVMKL